MKKVMVFGTFDLFHPGHRSFLKQAKKFGDYLIVVVARDETVRKVKKRNTRYTEKSRIRKIKESGLADKVVLGRLEDKYAVIEKYKPEIICLGYDQISFTEDLPCKLEKSGLAKTKIIRLEPHKPEKYKSSIIRQKS